MPVTCVWFAFAAFAFAFVCRRNAIQTIQTAKSAKREKHTQAIAFLASRSRPHPTSTQQLTTCYLQKIC